MNEAEEAAVKFISPGKAIERVETYGRGIIHDTYLVKLADLGKQFILQRLNTRIFKNPAALMYNLKLVTEHARKRIELDTSGIRREWQVLRIVPTCDGRDFLIDARGGFWRALSFIERAEPLEVICNPSEAGEVGRALGIFHALTAELDSGLLQEILPDFHNVEHYLKHYDAVMESGGNGKPDAFCRNCIEARRNWAPVLEDGRREKGLKVRVIHGDPKIDNIMVDSTTRRAVSIIDLDTVMPGLVHYDIGDAVRSCCNIKGEGTIDFDSVEFDLNRCKAFLDGYISKAHGFLTDRDMSYLFEAIRLVPFELGLRFYTDFLENNIYFKVNRKGQNLERSRVQFKLVESIERQEKEIRMLIDEYRAHLKMATSDNNRSERFCHG